MRNQHSPALPAPRTPRHHGSVDSPDQPITAFAETTPYDDYVRTMELHRLQHPLTLEEAEVPFLYISQIMELYFGLIRAEWECAIGHLRADELVPAIGALRRSVFHFEALNASWASLRWLTPMEFNRFRDHLGVASGFQSWAYRHVEFLVGLKARPLIRAYQGNPEVHDPLVRTLEAPCLYDEAIAALARAGLPIDPARLERDFSVTVEPDETVERAWVEVFGTRSIEDPLRMLADVLSDIAEAFQEWRQLHLDSVRRSMGAKTGSGGSSGLDWLAKSLARPVFPDLWSARTLV